MKQRKRCLLVDNQRAIEYAWEAASAQTQTFAKTAKNPLIAPHPRFINFAEDPWWVTHVYSFRCDKTYLAGELLGPTSFFGWRERVFLSQWVLLICVTTHMSKCHLLPVFCDELAYANRPEKLTENHHREMTVSPPCYALPRRYDAIARMVCRELSLNGSAL